MPLWDENKLSIKIHLSSIWISSKAAKSFSLKGHLSYMQLHVLISFLVPTQYAYFWKTFFFASSIGWRAFQATYPCWKLHSNCWCHELHILHKWKCERLLYRHDPTHPYVKNPYLLIYLPGHKWWPIWLGCTLLGAGSFIFVCLQSSEHITGSMENKERIAIIRMLSHLLLKKFRRVELW